MKVDITELFIIFDELLPETNEELGHYRLKSTRADGIFTILDFLIPEKSVNIIVRANNGVCTGNFSLHKCSTIRVLDEQKKCVEILNNNGRCFFSLMGDSLMNYTEKEPTRMAEFKKEMGLSLKLELDKGYHIPRISSWAQHFSMKNQISLNRELEDLLLAIYMMDAGPEFAYTFDELRKIVQLLIDDVPNVFMKIELHKS